MRLIFAGTPEFAQQALVALHAAGHEIALVLTQPDRPAGRGLQLQASPVKQFALAHQLPLAQPRSLRLDGKYPDDARAAQQAMAQAQADAMVVAAYGLILPAWALAAPPLGCLNIHASLLPRWRGAAPIHRAIEAGDAQTGVCIMQMDVGLDTGAVLLRRAIDIHPDDTTASLHDRLAALGAQAMLDVLAQAQPVVGPAPNGGRHHLCRQNRKTRSADRLVAACHRAGAAHPRLRPLPRRPHPVAGAAFENLVGTGLACPRTRPAQF